MVDELEGNNTLTGTEAKWCHPEFQAAAAVWPRRRHSSQAERRPPPWRAGPGAPGGPVDDDDDTLYAPTILTHSLTLWPSSSRHTLCARGLHRTSSHTVSYLVRQSTILSHPPTSTCAHTPLFPLPIPAFATTTTPTASILQRRAGPTPSTLPPSTPSPSLRSSVGTRRARARVPSSSRHPRRTPSARSVLASTYLLRASVSCPCDQTTSPSSRPASSPPHRHHSIPRTPLLGSSRFSTD